MADRPSSSRNPERDSSPERSRSASPSNHNMTRILFTQSLDHQASTSSGLSDTTRPGSKSGERQSNDSPDQLQKRFQDLLAELKNRPHVSKEILDKYKQEFQEKANESERKKHIEDLEKQLEIDKNLGDVFFTNKSEQEVTKDRILVLDFLSDKIQNASDTRDKRTIFGDWSCAINFYCIDHYKLINEHIYNTTSIDMKYCLEADISKIKALDTSEQSNSQERPEGANSSDNRYKHSNLYKGPNLGVHKAITAINEPLYTEQERERRISLELFRSGNQVSRKYFAQFLNLEQKLELYVDLYHDERLEFYRILADLQRQFDLQRREFVQRLDSRLRLELFNGLELLQQKDLFKLINHSQQKDLFNVLNAKQQKYLFNVLNAKQQKYLFNVLNAKQQKYLFKLINHSQQKELFNVLNDEQQKYLFKLINHSQQKELFNVLNDEQQKYLFNVLNDEQQQKLRQQLLIEAFPTLEHGQQRELYLGFDPQQQRELVQGLEPQQQRNLYLGLDPQQQRELVQGLEPQQQRNLYLGLDPQQQRELVQGLDLDKRLEFYHHLDHISER